MCCLYRYGLSSWQSGAVVSASLLGALAGSAGAFAFGDALGRRKELLLAAALYGERGCCCSSCHSPPRPWRWCCP